MGLKIKLVIIILMIGSSRFLAIDAAFSLNDEVIVLIDGDKVVKYNVTQQMVVNKSSLSGKAFPGVSFSHVDAAINYGNGKVYLFSGKYYTRFDLNQYRADEGYPKLTEQYWEGFGASQIHAATNWTSRSYYFSGDQYLRFNPESNRVDEGYPKAITAASWPGLSFKTIDAACSLNGLTYFFSGDQFIVYDISADKALPGYPKQLKDWTGLYNALNEVKEINVSQSNFDPKTFAHHNVSKKSIDLGDYRINNSNSVLGKLTSARAHDGTVYVGFNQDNDVIILHLNANGEKLGSPIAIKGHWLSEILCLPDGGLAILVGRDINNDYLKGYPNTLYFYKYDKNGTKEFSTKIFGGEGHGPGKSWFDGRSDGRIAFNGSEFGIYFEVQKNWAKSGQDIHNGDMFVVTDLQGNIKEDRTHFWTASHSSTVQVLHSASSEFYTMTIGDSYPYGLQVYNRNQDQSFVPYPPEEDMLTYEEVQSTNAAGILEFAGESNGNLVAVLGSTEHPNVGVFTKVDPLFLLFDKQGNVIKSKWLKQSPAEDESVISVNQLNDMFFIGWGTGNDYDKGWEAGNLEFSVYDAEGNTLVSPIAIQAPFGTYGKLIILSNNKICWFDGVNGGSTIDIYVTTFSKNPAP